MPDIGGTYSRVHNWANDEASSIGIESTRMDEEDDSIATALNNRLMIDGNNSPGANIDWGGFKITNLADPTGAQHAATQNYVQNYVSTTYLAKAGGTMSGAIAMGTSKITGLGDAAADADALNRQTGDGRYMLQTTFPNITGNVTATQAEINKLDGATVTTAELNYLDGATGVSGTGNTVRNTSPSISGISLSGTSDIDGTITGGATLNTNNASVAEPGYRGTPFNSQSDNYTFVLSDAGKMIPQTGASKTLTIPANASVAFPIGTIIQIYATAPSCTLAITSDTLVWVQGGAYSTGSRTIAQHSVVTIQKYNATQWILYGQGIS